MIEGERGWELEEPLAESGANKDGFSSSTVVVVASWPPRVAEVASLVLLASSNASKYSSPPSVSADGLNISPKKGGFEKVAKGETICGCSIGRTIGCGKLTVKNRTKEETSGVGSSRRVRMRVIRAGE